MRLKRVGKRQQTTDLNDCDYNEVLRTETTLDELSRNWDNSIKSMLCC